MAEENFESVLEHLSEDQLREELTQRELDTTGDRDELITRIEKYDQSYANDIELRDSEAENEGNYSTDGAVGQDGENGEEEKEDENDFVVWADDVDEITEEEKRSKKDGEVELIDVDKAPAELFAVDMAKEKDQLLLTWNGQKIVVPCKEDVSRELKSFSRQLNIIAYPILVEDFYNEAVIPVIKSAVNFSSEIDEVGPGIPIKGYLRLKFGTVADMKQAMEVLNGLGTEERQITVQHFYDSDSEGHILSKVKGKGSTKDSVNQRLLFVSNIPAGVTEDELKEIFTDCLRVINPAKEESSTGHVYVEYVSEAAANEAVEKHRQTILKDQPLYVIKCLTERKESIGLLKDGLRKYWLEQVHSLEAIDRSTKSTKELADLDQKLHKYKKRINTDNLKRAQLGFPISEEEQFQLDPEIEEKEKEQQDKDKDVDRKSSSRKRSPPPRPRRFSPPRRGRGNYRGPHHKFQGPPRGGGGANPDALVNQLQHLVGVLSHKLPSEPSRYEYGERDDRGYVDPRSRERYHPYPAYPERSRFEGKRFANDDYGGDRKRRMDESDYMRYDRSHGDYRGFRGAPRW